MFLKVTSNNIVVKKHIYTILYNHVVVIKANVRLYFNVTVVPINIIRINNVNNLDNCLVWNVCLNYLNVVRIVNNNVIRNVTKVNLGPILDKVAENIPAITLKRIYYI